MKKNIFIIVFVIIMTACMFFIRTKKDVSSYSDNSDAEIQKVTPDYDSDYIEQPENITVIKSYDILNYSEPVASRILCEYLTTEIKKESSEIQKYVMQEHELTPEVVRAFEYDLNGDGVNEIIGIPPENGYYGGVLSMQFFILQKQDGKYTNISELSFSYEDRVNILSTKTCGYNDMQFVYLKENPEQIQYLKRLGLYKENLGHIIKYNIQTSRYNFKFFIKK